MLKKHVFSDVFSTFFIIFVHFFIYGFHFVQNSSNFCTGSTILLLFDYPIQRLQTSPSQYFPRPNVGVQLLLYDPVISNCPPYLLRLAIFYCFSSARFNAQSNACNIFFSSTAPGIRMIMPPLMFVFSL